MNRINEAIAFAKNAYGDRMRKAENALLVLHAMEAAEIAETITDDEPTIIATVLHDVVEDTDITMEEIREHFGDRVAEIVAADTEDKRPNMSSSQSWILRKQDTIDFLNTTNDISAKILILGDKLSNMRSFYRLKQKRGKDMWSSFNQRDPKMHNWYYRSIANALDCLSHTQAWIEFDRLIQEVFDEKKEDI